MDAIVKSGVYKGHKGTIVMSDEPYHFVEFRQSALKCLGKLPVRIENVEIINEDRKDRSRVSK